MPPTDRATAPPPAEPPLRQRPGPLAVALVPAAVALLVRLAVILQVGFSPEFFDVDGYHALALVGLAGEPVPTGMHPPGYSWFLLSLYELFGPRPRLVYVVQALLASGAVAFVAHVARRRWGASAGLLAGLLLAFDGHLAIATSVLAGETLTFVGLAIALGFLVAPGDRPRLRDLAIAALLLGLTSLVRTGIAATLLVPAALAFERTRPRRSLVRGGALVLLGMTPLLVFAAARAGRTGNFRIGSPWDVCNFWIGNNPEATGRIDPMPEPPGVPSAAVDLERRAAVLGPQATRWALTHPLAQLELVARRASYLFAPGKRDVVYVYGNGWAGEQPAGLVLAALLWSASAAPALLLLALLALGRGGDDRAWWIAAALVLLGALPYLASIGDPRFLLPFHAPLALAAAAVAAPAGFGTTRARRIVATLLAVAVVANGAFDLAASAGAIRSVAAPGGSNLDPPYHFAR